MTSELRAAHPALATWVALREAGVRRAALVTLVRTDGGASRPLGMHLALADDGRSFGSATIGGCADGRALTSAQRVLERGGSEIIDLPLAEEDALALGLGCAGTVHALVDAVELRDENDTARAFSAAETAMDRGHRAAMVLPLTGSGRILVSESGERAGSTGTVEGDTTAIRLGTDALAARHAESRIHTVGDSEWLVQILNPTRTVVIVGATEIAVALCALAAPLGWRTVLVDAREALLGEPRFRSATERHSALPAEVVAQQIAHSQAAVVLVAHDYKVELPVLRVALRSNASYVGMLGSRKRAAGVRTLLAEEGLTTDELSRLRAPIGLDIGAQGAAEIAVSIVGELVATWRGAVAAMNRS